MMRISEKSKSIKKPCSSYITYKEEKVQQIENQYLQQMKQLNNLSQYEPKISNMVHTVTIEIEKDKFNCKVKLDLYKLAHILQNCEFRKSRFPALILRLKAPKATCLIFENGKMVITGTKTQNQAEEVAKKVKAMIERHYKLKIEIEDIVTNNIISNGQLPFQVNLNSVNEDPFLEGSICYNRSLFPGIIYHLQNPKICIHIFYSGKVNFTGAKNAIQIKEAYNFLVSTLKKHSFDNSNI